MERRFTGRVAVVTGGAQGIGAAIAARLAREGAHCALWDLDVSVQDPRLGDLPSGSISIVKVDVADYGSVEAALAETEGSAGPPDTNSG